MKQIYDVDGEILLHQSHCQKISDTKFKKDVKVVQDNIRDENDNEFPLNEILMIDDSPEKFDQSLNNLIVFKTLTYDDKDSELLNFQQYKFLQCLKKNS